MCCILVSNSQLKINPGVRFFFRIALVLATSILALFPWAARAQFVEDDQASGVRYGEAITHKYRVGVVVSAVGGTCRGLFATVPVPLDWPEQRVQIVEEDISPEVKNVRYRTTDDLVSQMLVEIPLLTSGREARALVTYEIERRSILAPNDTSIYKIPKRVHRDVKRFLGPSPFIESRHPRIRTLSREIVADKDAAWEKTEAIYDHVREAVEYKNGPLKGAVRALRDGYGDCEELSSLFIALCRASDIPARTVWIPGHCYPEFYLVNEEGEGHWFPCQAAGARAFGEMPEQRPILQKGDNFRVPEKPKNRQRYVAEFLRGLPVKGGGKPKVRFVRELIE